MTWDVPVKDNCPVCGQTMFKKAGRGAKKPFCINESCSNFTPEEKRGGWRKPAAAQTGEEGAAPAAEETKKPAAKKTTAKKTAAGAKKTTAKAAAEKKTTAAKKLAAKNGGEKDHRSQKAGSQICGEETRREEAQICAGVKKEQYMHVLMLNGSPRANGNTALALHEMEKVFTERGRDTAN